MCLLFKTHKSMESRLSDSIRRYLDGTASPDEKKRVEEYYKSFSSQKDFTDSLTSGEKIALEEKILAGIISSIRPIKKPLRRHRTVAFSKYALALAASLAALLVLAFVYVTFVFEGAVRIITAYGEVKTHLLPDESEVTLNGNSVLEYGPFNNDGVRSIKFSGEGYFSIVHTASHQPFVVQIPGGYEIEVLGTEFNVSARESMARVVLNSGKVKLHGISRTESSIVMSPGDMVELKNRGQGVTRSVVDTERYSSWKDHRLIFDDTPLEDIVAMLQETYGYQVTVEDETLLQETFTGTIPGNKIDLLILGLGKIGLRINQQGKHIEIKK